MDDFEAEVAREDLRLARACLLLARDVRSALDVDAALARFDPWAARVDAKRRAGASARDALREVLVDEEGFLGSRADYHDPDNSLLDAVLDARRGLPISLSIVWIEVARRLGIPLVGVGLPGHFLVRLEDDLLDPYHGGGRVSEIDAGILVQRLFGPDARLTPAMLNPVGDRDVLARVLANLKSAYVRAGDTPRAIRVEDRLLQLNPYAFTEYRDRGLLKRAAGDVDGARADLARYVAGMPRAPDADAVRRLLAQE